MKSETCLISRKILRDLDLLSHQTSQPRIGWALGDRTSIAVDFYWRTWPRYLLSVYGLIPARFEGIRTVLTIECRFEAKSCSLKKKKSNKRVFISFLDESEGKAKYKSSLNGIQIYCIVRNLYTQFLVKKNARNVEKRLLKIS